MKRKARKARTAVYKATKPAFPLTWKKCNKCGKDFKLEPSYVYAGPIEYLSPSAGKMRLCRDCSRGLVSDYPDGDEVQTWEEKTREEASKYFGQEAAKVRTAFLLNRPSPPPAAPTMTGTTVTVAASGVVTNPESYAEKRADEYFNSKQKKPVKLIPKRTVKAEHIRKKLTLRG